MVVTDSAVPGPDRGSRNSANWPITRVPQVWHRYFRNVTATAFLLIWSMQYSQKATTVAFEMQLPERIDDKITKLFPLPPPIMLGRPTLRGHRNHSHRGRGHAVYLEYI